MTALSVRAQPLPPLMAPLNFTNYFAVAAVRGGLMSSNSNEVATSQRPLRLAWNPSGSDGANYLLMSGRASRSYKWTNNVGTNVSAAWPPPAPPVELKVMLGASVISCATNPPDSRFWRIGNHQQPVNGLVVIDDSTNLTEWNSPATFVPTNGAAELTICRRDLK